MKFSQLVREFCEANRTPYNGDLLDRFLKELPSIELQANVRDDIGEKQVLERPGKRPWHYRILNGVKFWNFRWPRGTDTEHPEWDEGKEINFPADLIQEIGSTGHTESGSRWIAFDVDQAIGGEHTNGLSKEELAEVELKCKSLDYAEVRRSTRGQGLHIYVHLEGFPTTDHDQHAALARAVLGLFCRDTGYDFTGKVDVCGGNTWFASRRATVLNHGFELLKAATRPLTPADLPNWEEQLEVVTKKRSRVSIPNENTVVEETLSTRIKQDATHKIILDEYRKDPKYPLEYLPDYHLYRCHTKRLEEVYTSLKLKGYYKTKSDGLHPGTANASLSYRPNGTFYVIRYKTQDEDDSWGWTRDKTSRSCDYNCPVTLETACRLVGGIWTGKYAACNPEQAQKLADIFGFKDYPGVPDDRNINFSMIDKTSMKAQTPKVKKKELLKGWGDVIRCWEISFPIEGIPETITNYERDIRHIITADRKGSEWVMIDDSGQWCGQPKDSIKDRIQARYGVNRSTANEICGKILGVPYTYTNIPFEPEFLPGRQINMGAQLAVDPCPGPYEHCMKILSHVFGGLDIAVNESEECRVLGIKTGLEYGWRWVSVAFQQPQQHLPGLYFYSCSRDNGKSTFHRMLGTALRNGYVSGVSSLNEKYNGLFAGAYFIYLDEDKVNPNATPKIKQWIEHSWMPCRMMFCNSFMLPNCAKLIATYNEIDSLPIERGDLRIVVSEVPFLEDEDKIPWGNPKSPGAMQVAIKDELPHLIYALLHEKIPDSKHRLYLPILHTEIKEKIINHFSEDTKMNTKLLCDRVVEIMCGRVGREIGDQVIEGIDGLKKFEGRSGEFLRLLGNGPWEHCPTHLRNYMLSIAPDLLEKKVKFYTDIKPLYKLEVINNEQ